jgi:hypothetical protein
MDIKIQKFPLLLLWLVAAEKGRRSGGEGGFDFAQLVTLGMTWE